nr:MAG: hypothetical protein [Longfin eel circovirus]
MRVTVTYFQKFVELQPAVEIIHDHILLSGVSVPPFAAWFVVGFWCLFSGISGLATAGDSPEHVYFCFPVTWLLPCEVVDAGPDPSRVLGVHQRMRILKRFDVSSISSDSCQSSRQIVPLPLALNLSMFKGNLLLGAVILVMLVGAFGFVDVGPGQ